MGDLLIRNIPEAVKREIAEAAKARGQSLSDKAVDLLQKGLLTERDDDAAPKGSAWQALRAVFESQGAPDGGFAEVMEEVEALRKRDFGRPVSFGIEADDEQ
ncbi:plasmid stabilization protein [Aminobacter sp. BE322]|uniref:plasmid stabilization protein n=1 Tax=unclassified Aminobacter TaxID=2644704 RepID=UPI003D2501CC